MNTKTEPNTKSPVTWGVIGATSYQLADLLPKSIYPDEPKIGLVIGTFASVPYVHLQLEMRRQLYPHIPLLVHDDSSHKTDELRDLCERYGADFEQNNVRLPPFMGDMMVFVGGLKWARDREYDIVVKMSRRFLPLIDWSKSLSELAVESQYPTFCSWTSTYGFGFRTECVGMSVNEWYRRGPFEDIVSTVYSGKPPALVEAYIHDLSRKLMPSLCTKAREYDARVGQRPQDKNAYAVWDFMGTDRHKRYPGFLWHNSHNFQQYWGVANKLGMKYKPADFDDPNQGAGSKPAGY